MFEWYANCRFVYFQVKGFLSLSLSLTAHLLIDQWLVWYFSVRS